MDTQEDSFARELDQLHRNADKVFGGNMLDKTRLKRINLIKNQLHKIEDGDVVIAHPYQNVEPDVLKSRHLTQQSEPIKQVSAHEPSRRSDKRPV